MKYKKLEKLVKYIQLNPNSTRVKCQRVSAKVEIYRQILHKSQCMDPNAYNGYHERNSRRTICYSLVHPTLPLYNTKLLLGGYTTPDLAQATIVIAKSRRCAQLSFSPF